MPVLILACWLSDTNALKEVLLLTLRDTSTKRWQGYERLALVHICIAILIIWFSSGCYCVPFYQSGYKIQTLIPVVPWARFSHLSILTGPLEPIAFDIFLPEALSSIITTKGVVKGRPSLHDYRHWITSIMYILIYPSMSLSAVCPVFSEQEISFVLVSSTVCICLDSIHLISCNGCRYDECISFHSSYFNLGSIARRIKWCWCKWQYQVMWYGIHWQLELSALKWVAIVTRWKEI